LAEKMCPASVYIKYSLHKTNISNENYLIMDRKNQSPLEDMIHIASWLPWWVSLLLAIASFIILSQIANIEIKIQYQKDFASSIDQLGVKYLFIGFAHIGQFILPMAFICGAIFSAIKQRKTKKKKESF